MTGDAMTSRDKADWLIPGSLIALSFVPVAAGAARLAKVAAGAAGPVDARFTAAPAPMVLHIVAASVFCVLGALQFSPGLRRRRSGWHRAAGRVLIPCGLAVALTGLWMAVFYPDAVNGGSALVAMRLVVGSAMAACLVLAAVAIRRRDFGGHGAWMIRGYALGQGAGTQVITGLPWILLVGPAGVTSNAVLMGAGWAINIALAEWVIQRRRTPMMAGAGP
jgi:uncharacterized membrane protein YozB (DUF420 family)